jgi:hypothetical protein
MDPLQAGDILFGGHGGGVQPGECAWAFWHIDNKGHLWCSHSSVLYTKSVFSIRILKQR